MTHFLSFLRLGLISIFVWSFLFIPVGECIAEEEKTVPDFKIIIVRDKAVVGEKVLWHLDINVPKGQSIDNLTLTTGDAQGWQMIDMPLLPNTLMGSYVQDLTSVPLIEGELLPALKADYTYAGTRCQTFLVGETPLFIEPVHKLIEIETVMSYRTFDVGDTLGMELQITNHSPFTLTNIQVHGQGVDLGWLSKPSLDRLPAHTKISFDLKSVIRGKNPYPSLGVEYQWQDLSGTAFAYTEQVVGEAILVKDNILGKIPDELLGVTVGVVTGALSTFITGLVAQTLKDRVERKNNEQRAEGLLRLIVLQAQYAVNSSTKIDTEPLLTLFEEKEIFAVLEKYAMVKHVEDLWTASIHHNNYLNSPSGSQRARELKKAIEDLIDVVPREWNFQPPKN